jgi:hypothetical protein
MILWLIILAVIGLLGLVGYRRYTTPPLSKAAKQQRETYLRRFQCAKTLIYGTTPSGMRQLVDWLASQYFNAGWGCFYGMDLTIHLRVDGDQVVVSLFCPTADTLSQHAWRLAKQVGRLVHGTADG